MTPLRLSLPLDAAAIAAINALGRGVTITVEGDLDRRWTIADIIAWVAFETGVSRREIIGEGRTARQARARFAITWGARTILACSSSVIGRSIGGRDHTVALYQLRRAEQLRLRDPAFRALTNRMIDRFSGGPQ
ncbi:hypothetical protein D1610_11555 [Sphingomonas gilva]|uniref:Chromosomal replication initiator DnaA C-terminal domain-containing protein n=1 Tax=Sphingomonas gilva TaxID=2305907 RepID=A0A396RLI8_9SPHN|nr:helix-turn-helix domain-containing protein [Sphingomonas gilva]RHW17178.1 hypothetical protein D1610_11555 [Sphingomonas gilva]